LGVSVHLLKSRITRAHEANAIIITLCAHTLPHACIVLGAISYHDVQGARELQQAGPNCVAFVPFRPSDYSYVKGQASFRRRESFAELRVKANNITGQASVDGAWRFESIDGSMYNGEDAMALQALPFMNKRSYELYAAYMGQALLDATGADLNAKVGASSKKPYYMVQSVCSGSACAALTPAQRSNIQQRAESARATLSCAANPVDLALPFTEGALLGLCRIMFARAQVSPILQCMRRAILMDSWLTFPANPPEQPEPGKPPAHTAGPRCLQMVACNQRQSHRSTCCWLSLRAGPLSLSAQERLRISRQRPLRRKLPLSSSLCRHLFLQCSRLLPPPRWLQCLARCRQGRCRRTRCCRMRCRQGRCRQGRCRQTRCRLRERTRQQKGREIVRILPTVSTTTTILDMKAPARNLASQQERLQIGLPKSTANSHVRPASLSLRCVCVLLETRSACAPMHM
jgi:hypothetical protein